MCVDDLPFLKNGDFPYGKVFDYRRVSFHPSDLLNTPQKKTWFKLVNRLFTYGGFLSHRGIYPEIIHVMVATRQTLQRVAVGDWYREDLIYS